MFARGIGVRIGGRIVDKTYIARRLRPESLICFRFQSANKLSIAASKHNRDDSIMSGKSLHWISSKQFGLFSDFCDKVEWVASGVSTAAKYVWKVARSVADYAFANTPTDKPPTHSAQATKEDEENKKENKKEDIKFPLPPMPDFCTQNINIAVIGDSGNGKSSFINAFLDKAPDDPDRAETGYVETTGVGLNMKIQHYVYEVAGGKKVFFWDLPGCGTNNYPFNEYISKMGLRHFDFCLLITSQRFTEHDDKLIYQLNNFKVPVPTFIIRSKFDIDLKNHCHDKQINFDKLNQDEQKKIIAAMRDKLTENICLSLTSSKGFIEDKFFILSSRYIPVTYEDWNKFNERLSIQLMTHRQADQRLIDKLTAKLADVRTLFTKKYEEFFYETEKVNPNQKQKESVSDKQLNPKEQNQIESISTSDDWLSEWLNAIGLAQYRNIFIEHGVYDKDDVMVLEPEDFKKMKLKLTHQKKILAERDALLKPCYDD